MFFWLSHSRTSIMFFVRQTMIFHRILKGGAGIRSMVIGLGSGVGIGITYADAKRDFEELSPETPEGKNDS